MLMLFIFVLTLIASWFNYSMRSELINRHGSDRS